MLYSNLTTAEIQQLFRGMGLSEEDKPIVKTQSFSMNYDIPLPTLQPWTATDHAISDRQMEVIRKTIIKVVSAEAVGKFLAIVRMMSSRQASDFMQMLFRLSSEPTDAQIKAVLKYKDSLCPEVLIILDREDYKTYDKFQLSDLIGRLKTAYEEWLKELPTREQFNELKAVYRRACGHEMAREELAYINKNNYPSILAHYQQCEQIQIRYENVPTEDEILQKRRDKWEAEDRQTNNNNYNGFSDTLLYK